MIPTMTPYRQLCQDVQVQAFTEKYLGSTEVHNVFHVISLMCMPAWPESDIDDKTALAGGCVFYGPSMGVITGNSDKILELWVMSCVLGAGAFWQFEKVGSGVTMLSASDSEPFHRRVVDLLDSSYWHVLRTPMHVAGLLGF